MASVRRLGSHSDESMCRSDVDLNLGCPQDIAREEHFGAYLLGKKDWPLVQDIGKPPKSSLVFGPSAERITSQSLVSIAISERPCLCQITTLQPSVIDTRTRK